MGPPTRRGGVPELPPSICPRTPCLASPMTIVMYQQFRSWIAGIATYRTEDTTGHNLIHALSIRAVHLPPSYPTRFPDCVGLEPNSTATMLRTAMASDTGLSSRSTGHNGSGINLPACNSPVIIHHTSIFGISLVSALLCFLACHIFASRSSRFLFHFKTRRRSTEVTLRQLQ